MRTKAEILNLIEEEDVELIRLQFTDMFGNLKNIAVTAEQAEHVLDHGVMFRGDAMFGECDYEREDLYLHPDWDTFLILPWRPQHGKIARFLCDIYHSDGSVYEWNPRRILQRVINEAKAKKYTFQVDPGCEFFLFQTDENGCPTTITYENAGFMDVAPTDCGENARRELVMSLEEMGFHIESLHHESEPSQHEIDLKADDPMKIADAIVTFKSAVRLIVKRFGLHATFMPKPRRDMAGSGMYLNISTYKEGENLFSLDSDSEVISEELNYFIGGIMKYAPEMCAVTNPLVNSYKRLMFEPDAPKELAWSQKNVGAAVKVQSRQGEDTRVCLKFPDPAANPYLALAVCIAAGVKGMEEKIDVGLPKSECCEEGKNVKCLPGTLREAVLLMQRSDFMKNVLGESFVYMYTEAKLKEWDAYMADISQWELTEYLNRI